MGAWTVERLQRDARQTVIEVFDIRMARSALQERASESKSRGSSKEKACI